MKEGNSRYRGQRRRRLSREKLGPAGAQPDPLFPENLWCFLPVNSVSYCILCMYGVVDDACEIVPSSNKNLCMVRYFDAYLLNRDCFVWTCGRVNLNIIFTYIHTSSETRFIFDSFCNNAVLNMNKYCI